MKTIKTILENETGKKVVWNDNFKVYGVNLESKSEAEKISKKVQKEGFSTSIIEKASRFFLNVTPDEKVLKSIFKDLLNKDIFNFGEEKVQVEFISANPTGPLTLGNGRGGVYGDVLANVLKKAGYDVTKEYYINDAGGQIEILGHSVLGDEEGQYKGEYIDELSKKFTEGSPVEVGQNALEIIFEGIKKTVSEMGIEFDKWFSEQKELRDKGKVDEIINWFKEKDLVYEKDGALWFKASEFGDVEDRVLIKQNGEPTYFGVDCAYHKNKFVERKFDKVINIWGADHHGDVARVKGFVEALGYKDKLEIILMQFVRLVKDGKSARMSKREGNFVLVDDILKEVGKDVFRYFMLTRSANTHMDFDMDLAKEQSKKNPVYYIQYAGARMSSLLEKASFQEKAKESSESSNSFSFGLAVGSSSNIPIKALEKEFRTLGAFERNLILKLAQFPEVVEDTSKDYQVHHLATYAHELAKTFTDFYENVRVLGEEDEERKEALLQLVFITRQILEEALNLLGIEAPEKM